MRILKYMFLLLVLLFVGISVFVATQKGDYDIVRSKVIKTPRHAAFSYVNDYTNWENWMAWDDSSPDFTYSNVSAGKGASFKWDGSLSDGSMHTLSVRENDSIAQRMDIDGSPSDVWWTFKDTLGGTKITWRIKGKMGFMPKIRAALQGGPEKVMGDRYARSLMALNKTLIREINSYKIKIDGVVQKPGNYFLYQSITSTIDNMPKNIRVMLSKLLYFFKKNKVPIYGKPFISYDYFDREKGVTKFSVCIPVADEVFIAQGSDIQAGKFGEFRAVKTTLTGDHSHLTEAWDKTFAYMDKYNLNENETGKNIEWYKTGKEDIKSPSKWVTEIYIPIQQMVAVPVPVRAAVAQPVIAEPAASEEISIP